MAKKLENNGVIRDFDLKKDSIRVLYYSLVVFGFIMALIGFFPLIWLVLAGFKTIGEFANEVTILPKSFDFITKISETITPDLSVTESFVADPLAPDPFYIDSAGDDPFYIESVAPEETDPFYIESTETDPFYAESANDDPFFTESANAAPFEPVVTNTAARVVKDRYFDTWSQLKFPRYYRNSLFVVLGSIASAIFFNGLLGYVLSKVKPMGSKVVHALIMWSLLIPATTSIVPLFVNLARLHLTGSFIPLWLGIGANAFFVVLFKNFFDDIPESLIEAAKLDGAKDFTIFIRVVIPLSQAIVIVIILYAINAAWSDFLLPYLLLGNSGLETVMVKLFEFHNSRYSDVQKLQAIVFSVIPPIVVFFLFQRQITQISMRSGIK
jgi:multiple sugar transport system permease protein